MDIDIERAGQHLPAVRPSPEPELEAQQADDALVTKARRGVHAQRRR
jgi:hypothetical protein